MFNNSTFQIISNTKVENGVIFICNNVEIVFHIKKIPAFAGMTKNQNLPDFLS